jgi:hypothetical protein
LLSLAAAAPDHGLPMPWRLMIVPASQRQALAEVQAMGQRNLCHRGARLPTLIQYALLESIVMASTRRAGSAWSFWHGVHFESWWSPSSRYRFSGSRRVRWTLTSARSDAATRMRKLRERPAAPH